MTKLKVRKSSRNSL